MSEQPTTRLRLTMEGRDLRRLAGVLKRLLRATGWRCVRIEREDRR